MMHNPYIFYKLIEELERKRLTEKQHHDTEKCKKICNIIAEYTYPNDKLLNDCYKKCNKPVVLP